MKHVERGVIDRIIEMAWEDRTPFEAIEAQFGLNESSTTRLMRQELSPAAFRRWRARVSGRSTKHVARRPKGVSRHQSKTHNKVNR
ncbi:MAG: TIGR03643 family protein [Woeseiaceae bacterium]|nr:TIGR03643 family protein [Woeseiaceae bacterium]